jgi:hypothetical protein
VRYLNVLNPKALIAKLPTPNAFLGILNSGSSYGVGSSADWIAAAS